MKIIKANEPIIKKRLDLVVGEHLPELSRSYIARLIDEQKIKVNGEPTKGGYKLREGDSLEIDFDTAALDKIPDIDLPVIYEDDDVIVIDKPAGVISHSRGRYWDEPSVASFIRQRTRGLEGERAGIVHRLDRATSGVMICAKNQPALSYLQKQFGNRSVKKKYTAVCEGYIEPDRAVIDAPIARNPNKPTTFMTSKHGKPAQTRYQVLNKDNGRTLVEFEPLTGRTHQLRVHAAFVGHPIVGDVFYGNTDQEGRRLLLHANSLEITLPDGKRKVFESSLPKEFENA